MCRTANVKQKIASHTVNHDEISHERMRMRRNNTQKIVSYCCFFICKQNESRCWRSQVVVAVVFLSLSSFPFAKCIIKQCNCFHPVFPINARSREIRRFHVEQEVKRERKCCCEMHAGRFKQHREKFIRMSERRIEVERTTKNDDRKWELETQRLILSQPLVEQYGVHDNEESHPIWCCMLHWKKDV